MATLTQVTPLRYCHWNAGEVPVAATLNEVVPPAHMLAFTGSAVISTGTQLEFTVTVTVKGVPVQVGVAGVTV